MTSQLRFPFTQAGIQGHAPHASGVYMPGTARKFAYVGKSVSIESSRRST